tara:strand:+ start:2516 stop:3997 length:1482 start_codon:yes stop_codon:yes gene_type:complete
MAIIKCDDVGESTPILTGSFDSDVTVEAYVEQAEVGLGKTLLAVEYEFFLRDTVVQPVLSDVNENLLETRPQDIVDTLRADSNRYWTLDKNGNMKYMNKNISEIQENTTETDFPIPPFTMNLTYPRIAHSKTALGFDITKEYCIITPHEGIEDEVWEIFIEGGSYTNDEGSAFSRPSTLVPTGSTFTDHAFTMNTPFSKKELEMFANIDGHVNVADVESDYDFFAKAYEEGIASTVVPENALPHLYTEVQKSENTTELPKDYLRSWVSKILSDSTEMNKIAEDYENVAILDSVVDEENILDSENKTTSAFEILMAYANRENLFPMNVNIEVDTNNASDLMFEAEDVGMVDDIVRLLMGDGDIVEPEEVLTFDEIEFVDEPDSSLNEEALEGFYNNIANSVSLLNESANAAAYMSENFVNEVRIFIEDLINGDYLEDQAQYILNQFALLNSNGGFLPDEISALTTAQQSLANIMNSMSIMSNFQYAQQSVNKYV